MTLGTMATDCEIRIDYAKLRKDRLQKANEQLKKDGLGALLCFDADAIRYITSTRLGDWTNNKLARCCMLDADNDPILFEIVGKWLFDVEDHSVNARMLFDQSVKDGIDILRIGHGAVEIGREPCDVVLGRDGPDADKAVVVPFGVVAAKFDLEALEAVALDPVG